MDNKLTKFSQLLRSKKNMISCIFITLIFQFIILISTIEIDQKHLILYKIYKMFKGKHFIILLIVIIIIIFFLAYLLVNTNLSFLIKQLLFIILTIIFGLMLSIIINDSDKKLVKSAIFSTLINFFVMFVLGLIIVYYNYDLSLLGIFLFVGLLSLITISFTSIFLKGESYKNTQKFINISTIIIFSLYILYDTNIILLKLNNNNYDCVKGALFYYTDILNLFIS